MKKVAEYETTVQQTVSELLRRLSSINDASVNSVDLRFSGLQCVTVNDGGDERDGECSVCEIFGSGCRGVELCGTRGPVLIPK